MMTVRILVVGPTKAHFLREGEAVYVERIKRYARFEWIEVKPAKSTLSQAEALAAEGDAILKRLPPRHYLICLEKGGKTYDSIGFAERISRLSQEFSSLCFIIGGCLGFHQEVRKACMESISLSAMTLTHEMIRLILLEQIYRAFTILRGEPYHK